jgi:hypothetical protein
LGFDTDSPDNQIMRFSIKTAGSLVLSSVNLFLCAAGLSLAYTRLSPDLGAVIIWLVPPPLLLFTVAYSVADFLKPMTRKQAIVAAFASVPVA